jgi:hypothetical protein
MLPAYCTQTEHTKAISVLKAYAFIAEQESQTVRRDLYRQSARVFNIHPLVHLAMRLWLKAHNQWEMWNEKTVARLLHIMPYGDCYRGAWIDYIPHAIHVVELPDNRRTKGRIWLMEVIAACESFFPVHIVASNRWYQLAAEQGEELLGVEYSDVTSVSTRAKVMTMGGATVKSIDLLREAITAESVASGGVATHTMLVCIVQLGAAWNDMGVFKSAEMVLRPQLASEERVPGSLPPQILVTTMAHL